MIITGRSDQVLFELAKFHAPSTIFLDELESVMGQRGGGHGSVQPHGQGGPGGTGLGSLVGPVCGGPGGTGLSSGSKSRWDRSLAPLPSPFPNTTIRGVFVEEAVGGRSGI